MGAWSTEECLSPSFRVPSPTLIGKLAGMIAEIISETLSRGKAFANKINVYSNNQQIMAYAVQVDAFPARSRVNKCRHTDGVLEEKKI